MAIFDGVFTEVILRAPRAPAQTSPSGAGVFEGIFTEISELLPPPPISFSLDQATVANDGGTKINATGAALPDGTYEVRVGPTGNATDPVCYGGLRNPGRPNVQLVGGAFTCIVPPNPIGGMYRFTFTDTVTKVVNTSAPILTVVAHDFASRVLSLRRLFPPKWKAGTRNLDFEDLPQS